MTPKELAKFDTVVSRSKWNNIGNGYRWRVETWSTVGGRHDAVVIGPGGGQLYRVAHYGYETAERDAIRACHKIRNSK